jgi:acetyl esterase/lipase
MSNSIDTINSGTPPTCVVVATADELLGTEDSYDLAKAVKDAGVESQLYIAQDMVSTLALGPSHHKIST